jgi:hypothetical protein
LPLIYKSKGSRDKMATLTGRFFVAQLTIKYLRLI